LRARQITPEAQQTQYSLRHLLRLQVQRFSAPESTVPAEGPKQQNMILNVRTDEASPLHPLLVACGIGACEHTYIHRQWLTWCSFLLGAATFILRPQASLLVIGYMMR
jgi:hypothetical protein